MDSIAGGVERNKVIPKTRNRIAHKCQREDTWVLRPAKNKLYSMSLGFRTQRQAIRIHIRIKGALSLNSLEGNVGLKRFSHGETPLTQTAKEESDAG